MNKRQRKKRMKKDIETLAWAVQFVQEKIQQMFEMIKEDPKGVLGKVLKMENSDAKRQIVAFCMLEIARQHNRKEE